MARLARLSVSKDEEVEDDLYAPPPGPSATRRSAQPQSATVSLSPSPAASFSSDKENRSSAIARARAKGRSIAHTVLPSPKLPTPQSDALTPREAKRRRVADRAETPNLARTVEEQVNDEGGDSQDDEEEEEEEFEDTKWYDPDQDIEVRRGLRKGLRDLSHNLNDSRAEFLAPKSTGIIDTLNEANNIIRSVKQTSDATLDSRLLVSTADLSYKKTAQLQLGDAGQSIDVDEFVSKCISFMRSGPAIRPGNEIFSSTPRQRRHRMTQVDSADGSDQENADPLDWAHFGRKACFPHNHRPPVPSFLLGPLSVQKRVRAPRTRREDLRKRLAERGVRPQELEAVDLERAESSSLTIICKKVRNILVDFLATRSKAMETEAEEMQNRGEDVSEKEVQGLRARYGLADDGGIPLFNFVVNPHSFGQTVENLFYVSFLIREGSVGVNQDGNGLPTLHETERQKMQEAQAQGVSKHQAVFALDYRAWRAIIDAFLITEPIIPDRPRPDVAEMGARGWYG
ncbi:MAG: nuclear protein [Piccolia ochrophora]|nr:MAG: nuclear protein [Piccolia ochrophora]